VDKIRHGDTIRDNAWHPIDYNDLKDWVKKKKSELDRSELEGDVFRYRKNLNTGAYEIRLSMKFKQYIYSDLHVSSQGKKRSNNCKQDEGVSLKDLRHQGLDKYPWYGPNDGYWKRTKDRGMVWYSYDNW